jgi:hypothetical protein
MSPIVVTPTTTTAPTTTAAETAAALCLGPSFVYGKRTPARIAAVQSGDGGVGFVVVGHFDKTEAARAAGIAIGYYRRAINGAVRLKPLAQISFRGAKGKISNKYLLHERSFHGLGVVDA